MPKKEKRLRRSEVEEVFKHGKTASSPGLPFKYLKHPKTENNVEKQGFSFVAPKSVFKKASMRNRLRRVGYEAVRKFLTTFPQNLYGVFVFNKSISELLKDRKIARKMKVRHIEDEIEKIIHKLH